MSKGDQHVVPVGDHVEHDANQNCICGPTAQSQYRDDDTVYLLWVHHSLDGREFEEDDHD